LRSQADHLSSVVSFSLTLAVSISSHTSLHYASLGCLVFFSTARSARYRSVVIFVALKRHRFNVLTLQRLSLVDLIVLVFCPFRWWRLVAEFAVPDLVAGIGDVAASSQGHSAQQNRRDGERHRRFWPFHRRCDRNRAQ